ncbi:TetR/AcrR family transcriptional regulator [Paradesulfitobacterium aromaticivorans]
MAVAREQKRMDMIKAAIRVFSEYGFDGAKMEFIAKEAGIGKGTIYEYFNSKEALFEETIRYGVEIYRVGLEACIEQGKDIKEKLNYCCRYNIEFLRKHLDMMHMTMQVKVLSKEIRTFLIEQHQVIFQRYREMVALAKAEGELRADLDEELATFLIHGTIDQFSKHRGLKANFPLQFDHEALVDVILKGLSERD